VRWRKTEVAYPFIGSEKWHSVRLRSGITRTAFIALVSEDEGEAEEAVVMVRHGHFGRQTLYGP
jgi:hypothetical protein